MLFRSEIDTKITNIKYGEEQKVINKGKKESAYHPCSSVSYPNVAVQNFGGEYPRNISMLNANRSGKSYLFSTQPPTWESQLKPPIYKNSLFDNLGNSRINEDVDYLREFLLRFERVGLSIKYPKRYEHLERWVNSIIDEVLFYTSSIQNLPSSWSATKDIKLKAEHQYFLDPYRDEGVFQSKRESTDWQSVVCNDFSRWLNNKLRGYEKIFTPQSVHTRIWKTLFETELRENSVTIEIEGKYSKQKENI